MKILTSILVLSLSGQALAGGCLQPVYHLNPGQPAECEGYLFSPEMEQRLRLMDANYPLMEDQVDLQKKQLDLYKQEVVDYQMAIDKQKQDITLWQTQATDSTQKYINMEERQGWRDYLFLGLGVLLTVSAAWATGQSQGHK